MSDRMDESDDGLVEAIRVAIVTWNSFGPRKVGDDVSQFIADWLRENRVYPPS